MTFVQFTDFPKWRADPPTWHAAYPPSDGFGNEDSAGMTPVAGPVGHLFQQILDAIATLRPLPQVRC